MTPLSLLHGMLLQKNTKSTTGQRKVGKLSQFINHLCKRCGLVTAASIILLTHIPHRWYNAPTKQGSETNCPEDKIPTAPMSNHDQGSNGQEDSTPLDFDTFVPSHNPSLHVP